MSSNTTPKMPRTMSLKKAQMYTRILQEELESGFKVLDRIKRQKQYIAQQVVAEMEKQIQLREKIEFMKQEIVKLNATTEAQQKVLDRAREKRIPLSVEMVKVESELNEVRSQKSVTIKNDFSKLIEAVNLTGDEGQTQKSVLLTCARDIIKVTEENEFEVFDWRAVTANSNHHFGMRLRLENLSLTQNNIHEIYQPVIALMARKFMNNQLKIKTKWKKENGIVVAIDMTMMLPIKKQSFSSNQMEV